MRRIREQRPEAWWEAPHESSAAAQTHERSLDFPIAIYMSQHCSSVAYLADNRSRGTGMLVSEDLASNPYSIEVLLHLDSRPLAVAADPDGDGLQLQLRTETTGWRISCYKDPPEQLLDINIDILQQPRPVVLLEAYPKTFRVAAHYGPRVGSIETDDNLVGQYVLH